VNGAQILCPDRHQQFHGKVLERRKKWRTEVKHRWSNGDAAMLNRTYGQLVAEGSLVIETSRQKPPHVAWRWKNDGNPNKLN
jgi:hypothetical protein